MNEIFVLSDSANAQKENFCGHHLVLSQYQVFLPPENLTNYIVPNKKEERIKKWPY